MRPYLNSLFSSQCRGVRANFPVALLVGLTIVLTIVSAQESHAIKPHRCNGKIQFTPCTPPSSFTANSPQSTETTRQTGRAYDPRFPIRGPRFAEVVSSSFKKLNRSTGLWSGVIRGNGLVETELQIVRDGAVESSRYMGHVWLQNKTTPFKITSSLPTGRNWAWRMAVWAR